MIFYRFKGRGNCCTYAHHMHCTVWVPNPDGQKILADEKPSLVFLLDYNIQAWVNFLASPHIWRGKEKRMQLNLCCYVERENRITLRLTEEHLILNSKYLAGIIVLKSSPEGQSFSFSRAVSPFFTFCRSVSNTEITKNWYAVGVLLYATKI